MCVINGLPHNQPCECQLDRNRDQPTSTTTIVVDDTAYFSARAHRGGWTQIFGSKASGPETSRRSGVLDRSKNAIFTYPTSFGAPMVTIPSEFRRDLLYHKTRLPGCRCRIVLEIRRSTVLIQYRFVTDRQTDRRTRGDSKYRTSIASRWQKCEHRKTAHVRKYSTCILI